LLVTQNKTEISNCADVSLSLSATVSDRLLKASNNHKHVKLIHSATSFGKKENIMFNIADLRFQTLDCLMVSFLVFLFLLTFFSLIRSVG